MATIATVRGRIDSADLGVTLMHEHICLRRGLSDCPEPYWDKAMDYQVELTRKAAEAGIDTLVNLTPWPDVEKIIELTRRVPQVNLVLSTGAYLEHATPPDIRDLDEQGMVDRMTKNLTAGYDGFEQAGVKAGIIKIAAAESTLTEWERKNFRAAARVSAELGVPIATHACAGAREQMELLREAGASIAATFYSHVEAEFGWDGRDLSAEADYLADVAAAGGYLQFNNFDFEFHTPFEDLLYLLNDLERRGLGERVFISIDANWQIDEDGRIWHEAEKEHPETGKRTYAYAVTHAVPMLMAAGVPLQRINRYLVDNPRRYFEAFDSNGPR